MYACPFGVLDPDSCDVNHIPEVRVATCPLCLLDRTNLGAVSGRITASAGDPGAIYNFSTSLFCADATAKVPRGEIPAILSPAGPDLCTGGKVWFSQFEARRQHSPQEGAPRPLRTARLSLRGPLRWTGAAGPRASGQGASRPACRGTTRQRWAGASTATRVASLRRARPQVSK